MGSPLRTSFPMSIWWTVYVAPTPQRGSKTQNGRFSFKMWTTVVVCYNFETVQARMSVSHLHGSNGKYLQWALATVQIVWTKDERDYLFQSHSLPFQWFIPIPNPMFNLVLFPFPSHSHWLFSFTPAPIPVLLVVSRSDNKWPVNSTMHTTDKSSI